MTNRQSQSYRCNFENVCGSLLMKIPTFAHTQWPLYAAANVTSRDSYSPLCDCSSLQLLRDALPRIFLHLALSLSLSLSLACVCGFLRHFLLASDLSRDFRATLLLS